jgi:hypothetical protein
MTIKNLIILNIIALVFASSFVLVKTKDVWALEGSSDAIAVRIIPNPHRLSAQNWYLQQGFSGSPQALMVDGYKAVRDGRTVYVSATNVDLGSETLYPNIYLISHDQGADSKTIDVFGRILDNWKFNININEPGSCLISDRSCRNDNECPPGYVCGSSGGGLDFQRGKCVFEESDINNLQNTPNCILDSDCPGFLFCDSEKAKIIRDLERLENFYLIENKIKDFYSANNRYPILGAGTYLPHIAVSSWPSWQSIFLGKINSGGVSLPINKLGPCLMEGYNIDTCWNPNNNIFFMSSINYNNFSLPVYSYGMAYTSNPSGSDYSLCISVETDYKVYLGDGVTIEISNNNCNYSTLPPYLEFVEIDFNVSD